ncbi:beta-phosphoglucomutase [Vagococcus sp. BWB3-3]|uniref:Beta-phosphoglucomutase n=1 Tax=Vagococcus allomyrinae TaxID=2794353 RepID=A0A940P492_9ENTE|nr:beta-phosphoglucomutase [Vagococcus allomyrinae]MBP1040745.1 beta-phosphoglucomutase [Vagococcus allomyrinae]
MTIKGFIFDLDGVITDTAEYHYHAWKNLGKKMGIEIDREFNEKLKGISRMDSLERILAYGGKADRYTDSEKELLAADKNGEYVKLIEDITPADLLPGIPQLLLDLKASGIKLALASASKNGPVILDRLGITADFDEIVDPSLLTKGKPDPEIFVKGAQQLGLEASECIGVEDAEAGIAAINGAHMFSVGVGDPESMKEADYRVANTSELSLQKILEAAGE